MIAQNILCSVIGVFIIMDIWNLYNLASISNPVPVANPTTIDKVITWVLSSEL